MVKISTSARSPLSPTLWPPEAFTWWRSLAVLALLLVAFGVAIVLQVAYVIAAHARIDPRHLTLDWNLVAIQLATYVPLVPALLAGLPWASGRSMRELGLRVPTAREVLFGIGGGAVMYLIVAIVSGVQFVITHQKPEQQAVNVLANAHDPALIAAFAAIACVIAPFVEEMAFRGFVFNALLRHVPLAVAAALSGLVFALAHGTPSALYPLWGGGIVLALVYYRTGVLTSSMISHATFNVVNVLLIVVVHQT